MRALCAAIKNCIQRCFRNEEDDYRERVLQLEERMLDRVSSKGDPHESNVFEVRLSQMSNMQSPKKNNEGEEQKPVRFQERNQQHVRQSNTSVDSYFTIHSGSASNQTLSRRTFRSVSRRKSISLNNKDTKISEFKEFKQINNENTNESDLKLSRVESQFNSLSEAMFEWNEIEYERATTNLNIQINTTQQMKFSSNILINEAVNKLEDYYTFYFNEINTKFCKSNQQQQQQFTHYHGHYFRKYPEYKCSYYSEHDNLNASETFMMLITFQSNTSNAIEFLKWYNSLTLQSKLYNFQRQKIIENGTYPIFEVEQFGSDIKEKYTYITVRQIENVKFDNQIETEYILQLDTTFRKGNNFKSLIRFSDSDNGMVEIYSECTEKIRCSPQAYFRKRWKALEAMIKQRFLKISVSRVVK